MEIESKKKIGEAIKEVHESTDGNITIDLKKIIVYEGTLESSEVEVQKELLKKLCFCNQAVVKKV